MDFIRSFVIGFVLGLFDGDGYIEIGPQKQYNKSGNTPRSTIRARLVIRLHSIDVSLLTYLTKVLGVVLFLIWIQLIK